MVKRPGGGVMGSACGCETSDVTEDTADGEGIGEEGEDPHFGAAVGAAEGARNSPVP